MAKKGRRKRSRESTGYYILQITDWDWGYHFAINTARHDDRAYSEFRHLLLRGKVLLPSRLGPKVEHVELTFMPNVTPADLERSGPHPVGIGYLSIHAKNLTGGISMATDALGPVLQMLIAGRFNYLVMYGDHMRYRRARIRSYHFEKDLNVDDYPDE